ncbi:MAG: hypothetical protein CK531_06115 [Gemmatimonadetes bacterium]|nr:MAG: hypothetical protein CK531_06115 [Gemmatimonadota bacterium]
MTKQAGKISRNGKSSDEPVGIVISSGTRREDSPRFAAYVWGPVPESELDAALNAGLVAVA